MPNHLAEDDPDQGRGFQVERSEFGLCAQKGEGWFRPGRLVRTRAAGIEKSHAGTGEPPRRLPLNCETSGELRFKK